MKVEILSKAATKLSKVAGKAGLALQKASPELMLGVGVVGIVGAGVWACMNSFHKMPDIIEEAHETLDDIEGDYEEGSKPYKKECAKALLHTTGEVIRIYSGPIILATFSIGMIIGSHVVLNRRYLGAAAAYKAVDEAYKNYRERIRNYLGEEKEEDIYYGREEKCFKKDGADISNDPNSGDPIITAEQGVTLNPKFNASPYAKFFDETSCMWKKDPSYNMMFLRCQQNFANDILNSRGHIFLNEVYDMLGIPRTKAGAVVGWILDGPDSHNFVDFGLYDCERHCGDGVRDFVNGYERSLLLDFNVDGIIYDKI